MKRILSLVVVLLLALSTAASAEYGLVNPNAGLGLYPGTSEDGFITVECSTMSKMSTITMTYSTEFSVARHCWESLVCFDAAVDGFTSPGAAESWTTSEDGLTWTFKIREGGKWVDMNGNVIGDVTANDFVFAWRELLNPANAAEYSYLPCIFKNGQAYYDYASGVEGAEEVKIEDVGFYAQDDYTLVCELENYIPYFIQFLKMPSMSPVYQKFYEEVGGLEKYGTEPQYLCFNGAFRMTEWIPENRITLVKNDSWRDAENVTLSGIHFDKYTDTNTKLNAFYAGELDMMDATGEQRAAFEAEGFSISSYVGGYCFYYLCNNTEKSDLRSMNLRKALSAAIDREKIISVVYKNDNEPAQAFALGISGVSAPKFTDAVIAANNGESLYSAASDPEAAKAYLDAAVEELGYADASEIKITILTSEGTQNEQISQVVQEQLRNVLGLEVAIDIKTITEARALRNTKDYDIFYTGWGPDYDDPTTDLDLWTTGNSNNHAGYSSEVYDGLMDAASKELDPAAREQYFIQAEQLIREDMPIVPVVWRHEDFVVSEKMASGYCRQPLQAMNFIYTKLAD